MRITEEIQIFWSELTGWQQVKIVGVLLIVLAFGLSGWFSSCSQNREVRKHEREAAHAKAEAAEHLERAAKIAEEKKALEIRLGVLEEKRNEKQTKLDEAMRDADDAASEYERSRREQRTDNPDADALCRELAELGYPCS